MNKNPLLAKAKNRGFALIATILLMVLLAIITVGTLSLSVVTYDPNSRALVIVFLDRNNQLPRTLGLTDFRK